MIPTHQFPHSGVKPIRVNELGSLMIYDAGKPHRHKYFEFFVFIKGGGIHLIDFEEHPIKDGSIHIVAPGQVHEVRRELDSFGYVFLFETEVFPVHTFISDFLIEHIYEDQVSIYPFEKEVRDRITEITKAIWNDYNHSETLKNEILQTGIMQLVLFCLQNKKEVITAEMNKHQQLYTSFRKLLHEKFRTIKKVSEYAQLLCVSEKTLNAATQTRTGNSTGQLIAGQLILEAKRLLQIGMSVKEVAYELNFDDPAHFTKFFKTKVGATPSGFQTR